MIWEIRYFIKCFLRALSFFKFGWSNHDFDDHYLLELEVFKLKRMLEVFLSDDSYHDPECSNYKIKIKSLKLAIKLGEVLCKDDFTKFHDLHYAKWGSTEWDSLPTKRPGMYKVVFRNKKARTKSLKEQMNKEFKEAWKADERIKARTRKQFYMIINKYGPYWWD